MDEAAGRWMTRAFEVAARGRCGSSPNPMVGAVVVDDGGRLAGEGHHAIFGGDHAEVVAIREAGARCRGASLYVTLEPCNHHGKTPPCTEAILGAGIRRVVIAMRDPHGAASGGLERLRDAGIEVALLDEEHGHRARRLNRRWLRLVEDHRPWVTLKAAVSLDGRIATSTGQSQWITGEAARRRGLELREEHDAILVGVGTVLADDPRLTRRLGHNPCPGWRRIVLDSRLRTPDRARVVTEAAHTTLIAHTPAAPASRRRALEARGIELVELPADGQGRVAVVPLLAELGRRQIAALLVEGGARVHGSFADAVLADELELFIAPILLGGAAPTAVAGMGVTELALAQRFCFETLARLGDDVELRAVTPEVADVHRAG